MINKQYVAILPVSLASLKAVKHQSAAFSCRLNPLIRSISIESLRIKKMQPQDSDTSHTPLQAYRLCLVGPLML
jgi:hypothetical protein